MLLYAVCEVEDCEAREIVPPRLIEDTGEDVPVIYAENTPGGGVFAVEVQATLPDGWTFGDHGERCPAHAGGDDG